jgi:hypothetical protein
MSGRGDAGYIRATAHAQLINLACHDLHLVSVKTCQSQPIEQQQQAKSAGLKSMLVLDKVPEQPTLHCEAAHT